MNTTAPATTAASEQVHHAVEVLAPRWTSWTLRTLGKHGPVPVRELATAMPWLTPGSAHQVVMRMEASGLVTRPERGVATLTGLGRKTDSTHRALASWHQRHFEQNNTLWKRADRVEDALAPLRGKGTLDMLSALDGHGPLRPGELREAAGFATGSFHYRTQQLLDDGLVTRLGPEQHFAYALTPAARQLAPVYAELHDFGHRRQAAQGQGRADRPAALASRATAARRPSPAAPAARGLFSHPPAPQPRVPAYVTALSHPSRTR
ncbi:hypothetical protein [Streptomyces sp. NPDC048172]|uniref:hypothetical protein n=1 Tax=Streptomyces sp. NPDC048172 TaxID=3365505 RepID=UPI003719A51B